MRLWIGLMVAVALLCLGVVLFFGADLSGAPHCGASVGPRSAACKAAIEAFNNGIRAGHKEELHSLWAAFVAGVVVGVAGALAWSSRTVA